MTAKQTRANLTQSYDIGARDFELIDGTIGEAFDRAVSRWGARPAVGVPSQGVRWTYAELAQRVDALAAALRDLRLVKGDRIGLWAPNRAEWPVVQYAAAKLGLVLVSINPAYRAQELEYALNKVGCRALVTATRLKSTDCIAILRELAPELDSAPPGMLASARLPTLRTLIHLGDEVIPGFYRYADLLDGSRASRKGASSRQAEPATLSSQDPIAIVYTSGTTGAPKGATFSHFQLLNNGAIDAEVMKVSYEDAICVPLPLYHIFGMLTGNLLAMLRGAEVVYTGEVFDPRNALAAIQHERCTVVYGVPTIFKMMLEHPERDQFNLSSLRTGLIAGSAVPIDLSLRLVEKLHVSQLLQVYGMTESSATITIPSLDDPLELRVGTAGRVVPHLEIKIVDSTGRIVPIGDPGEICFRGFTATLGYWGDEGKPVPVTDADGWMGTGDLATMDSGGYVRIVGRIKELVIRGGENIHPGEIEQSLAMHPKVDAVCIVGVPDEKYGEELLACIKLKPGLSATEDEIRDYCRGRIAHYKIPRHIRFVDSVPMTVTGKIQRHLLKQQVAEDFGAPAS